MFIYFVSLIDFILDKVHYGNITSAVNDSFTLVTKHRPRLVL